MFQWRNKDFSDFQRVFLHTTLFHFLFWDDCLKNHIQKKVFNTMWTIQDIDYCHLLTLEKNSETRLPLVKTQLAAFFGIEEETELETKVTIKNGVDSHKDGKKKKNKWKFW